MSPFQLLRLYAASSLHLLFPCQPSADHFTSPSVIHSLNTLIILQPFPPPSFPFAIQYLVPCMLSVIIVHYNIYSISLKNPEDNSYFINSALRDILAKTGRETRSGKENEGGKERGQPWENDFIASGEGSTCYSPSSRCTYLQNELNKNPLTPFLWVCTKC